MLETLDYTIRIGSTPTFLYFDLYLYSAYAAHRHYVYSIVTIYNTVAIHLIIVGLMLQLQLLLPLVVTSCYFYSITDLYI